MKKVFQLLIVLSWILCNRANAYTWTNINQGNSGLWGNAAGAAAFDSNNTLWLGYDVHGYGLQYFNGSTWGVYNHNNSGLSDIGDCVYSIFCEGNAVWIGTRYGLNKLGNNQWNVYNTSNSGLKNNVVLFTKKDKQGNYWISHGAGGFSVMTNGIIYPFPDTSICPYFRYGISDVVFDDTSAWISTSVGLVHFKLSDSSWVHFDMSNSNLLQNTIFCLARDHQGQIWIGYAGFGARGIAKFDGTTFQNWNPFSNSYTWVSNLAVDSSNNILIGTRAEGLYKFDGTTFTRIFDPPPDSAATSFLFVDQYDRIWYDELVTGIWISNRTNDIPANPTSEVCFYVYPSIADKILRLSNEYFFEDAFLIILGASSREYLRITIPKYSMKREIDIGELSAGIYFITLESESGRVTKKFIKE